MDNSLTPQNTDLDNLAWECHCCKQMRKDKFIKITRHDVSGLFDMETGGIVINVRHCNDMPGCQEKASDRKYAINRFFKVRFDNK